MIAAVNASQPASLLMTPSLIYSSLVNKLAGKDVNFEVTYEEL